MKTIFVSLALLIALGSVAYDFPGVRLPNNTTIFLLPDAPGKPVVLEFDKRDINGYVGSDPIVLTVVAPSGKNVCEVLVPDDGDTQNKWKDGSRQRVKIAFTPEETGVYVIRSNSSSAVDIAYCFDQASAVNAAWGIKVEKTKLQDGRVNIFLLLPPRKNGEAQSLALQLTAFRSRIRNLQVFENGKPLTTAYTPVAQKVRTDDPVFAIKRQKHEGILQLKADNFADSFWQFPGYGEFMIFPEERFAKRFFEFFKSGYFAEKSVKFSVPRKREAVAFAPGHKFQIRWSGDSTQKNICFTAEINGKRFEFTKANPVLNFATAADQTFLCWDWSKAPAGTIEIQELTAVPHILAPVSGVIRNAETPALSWTPVDGAKSYEIVLTHVESGRTIRVAAAQNTLQWQALPKDMLPGVWRWQVASECGAKPAGSVGFFIQVDPAPTQLYYLTGFEPFRDSLVTGSIDRVACRAIDKPLEEIDWNRSFCRFNDRRLAVRPGVNGTIETRLTDAFLKKGRNSVCFVLTDRNGNTQECSWGFDYQQATPRTITHDRQGRIRFNGQPFYPVIYYGYMSKKLNLSEIGFNSQLINSLPNKVFLDQLLKQNLKAFDAGCAFKDYTAEKIRDWAATPGILSHPARLGMWCDEIDVHRPMSWIKEHLGLFTAPNGGWKGICSCNFSLYSSMAEIGDYLIIDCYVGGSKLFHLDDVMVAGRQAAGQKPLIVLVSGFCYGDPQQTVFEPSINDAKYQAFSALRHGINGLGLYQCGPYRMECYPDLWQQVTALYRKISALTFITGGSDVSNKIRLSSENGKPVCRAFKVGSKVYVIVQNASFDPAIVRLQSDLPWAAAPVKVMFEDRVIKPQAGVLTDAMTGADTHVYSWDILEK